MQRTPEGRDASPVTSIRRYRPDDLGFLSAFTLKERKAPGISIREVQDGRADYMEVLTSPEGERALARLLLHPSVRAAELLMSAQEATKVAQLNIVNDAPWAARQKEAAHVARRNAAIMLGIEPSELPEPNFTTMRRLVEEAAMAIFPPK